MALSAHQANGSGCKQAAVCKRISRLHCGNCVGMLHRGNLMPLSRSLLWCPHQSFAESKVRLQGVRIDYALCTPGLLSKVVSCEMESLPPKWSDHAALMLGERGPASRHALLFSPAEAVGGSDVRCFCLP